MMTNKCPKCENEMHTSDTDYSLIQCEYHDDGSIEHKLEKVMPVHVSLCKQCGHIELRHKAVHLVP